MKALLLKKLAQCFGSLFNGGSVYGPHQALFVPPKHTRVAEAMTDLVKFMKRDDLPVFAQAVLAHAQFETIHPFPDGNGRTGRAIIHSLLRGKRLVRGITIPISAGLLHDVEAYFNSLGAYRNGAPDDIVQMMANASLNAINNGQTLVTQLRQTRAAWVEQIKARSDSAVWKIADLVLSQPVIDSPLVQRTFSITAANALRAIDRLEHGGVLVELSGSARNRMWCSTEVLTALDAFAERAGRRSNL